MCCAAIWSAVVPLRTSAPSVSFGCTPLSQTVPARECSPLPSPRASACFWLSPTGTITWSWNGASGLRVRGSSVIRPSPAGCHDFITAPLGM